MCGHHGVQAIVELLVGEMTLGEGFPQTSERRVTFAALHCGGQVGLRCHDSEPISLLGRVGRAEERGRRKSGTGAHLERYRDNHRMVAEHNADATSEEDAREWFHEALTMALYVSLSLLAVLLAQPPGARLSESNLWLTVLITAVALLLAHQVAFRLSSRLVNKGLLDPAAWRLLGAQTAGGLFAAAVASLPTSRRS